MKKYHFILAYLAIGLTAFLILASFYFLVIDANPPAVINSVPSIEPNVVEAGEVVVVTTDFCKYTSAESSLTAYWQRRDDGLIWDLTERDLSIAANRCGILVLPLVVPSDIPPGDWKRVNVATYKVNFMVSRTVEWESEYITVTE